MYKSLSDDESLAMFLVPLILNLIFFLVIGFLSSLLVSDFAAFIIACIVSIPFGFVISCLILSDENGAMMSKMNSFEVLLFIFICTLWILNPIVHVVYYLSIILTGIYQCVEESVVYVFSNLFK